MIKVEKDAGHGSTDLLSYCKSGFIDYNLPMWLWYVNILLSTMQMFCLMCSCRILVHVSVL